MEIGIQFRAIGAFLGSICRRSFRDSAWRLSSACFGYWRMLSSKAKYALRAAVFLAARHRDGGWVLAADIATAEFIPKKFLEAILVELRDSGIVDSRRGRHGGYRLTHAPDRVAAGDVIRTIDGPLALTPCTSRTRFGPCADCVDPPLCALRPVLQKARDAIAVVVAGNTVATLVLVGACRPAKRRRRPPAATE
jgi:Rrf2 family protein